ncbi:MAG: hypothetical protein AAFY84_16120 [Pseudomonadota bacterium]
MSESEFDRFDPPFFNSIGRLKSLATSLTTDCKGSNPVFLIEYGP